MINTIKKKEVYKTIIITVILLISIKQLDFFKKTHFTLTRSYDTRLAASYEFCKRESIGFLSQVKRQFNIDHQIPIVNYEISPNSSWYFNDLKEIKTNKVIFLNYTMDNKDFDYEKNNKFSHDLKLYKIIHKSHNCYYLEKND